MKSLFAPYSVGNRIVFTSISLRTKIKKGEVTLKKKCIVNIFLILDYNLIR